VSRKRETLLGGVGYGIEIIGIAGRRYSWRQSARRCSNVEDALDTAAQRTKALKEEK
jgi:hypothetical protein